MQEHTSYERIWCRRVLSIKCINIVITNQWWISIHFSQNIFIVQPHFEELTFCLIFFHVYYLNCCTFMLGVDYSLKTAGKYAIMCVMNIHQNTFIGRHMQWGILDICVLCGKYFMTSQSDYCLEQCAFILIYTAILLKYHLI